MFSLPTITYALLGGLLPALLWLWFFAHEDPHPEPRGRLIKTFVAGMIAVLIALALEGIAQKFTGGEITTVTLLIWAAIEEIVKYGAAWLVALRTKVLDEPVDALIYLLVVALGFAAVENGLFLIEPLASAAYFDTVLTGSLRFIGATLVHVVSSGALGGLLALSYYRSKRLRHEAALVGLTAAVALHWIFNLLIMNTSQHGLLRVFTLVWVGVIALMLVFERAKRVAPKNYHPNK